MVSGSNEKYLKKPVALGKVYEYMQNYMRFLPLVNGNGQIVGGNPIIPAIPETTDAFAYLRDDYNITNDPKKELPAEWASGAGLPEVDRTRKTPRSSMLRKNGFKLRLPHSVIRNSSVGSMVEINDNYRYAAVLMGELINTKIGSALSDGANTATSYFDPTVWSNESAADPRKDLKNLARDFKSDENVSRCTDALINEQNFYELTDYLESVDISDTQRNRIFGTPVVNSDVINIPAFGDVHDFGTSITESYILGLDRNNPAAEYHYYIDPMYSQATISYDSVVDNKKTRVTVNNLGIHYNTYVEDDTKDQIMEYWCENTTIVKKPKGLIYASGI